VRQSQHMELPQLRDHPAKAEETNDGSTFPRHPPKLAQRLIHTSGAKFNVPSLPTVFAMVIPPLGVRSHSTSPLNVEHSDTDLLPRMEGPFLTPPSHRAQMAKTKFSLARSTTLSAELLSACCFADTAPSSALPNRSRPAFSIPLPACSAEEKDGSSPDHLPISLHGFP